MWQNYKARNAKKCPGQQFPYSVTTPLNLHSGVLVVLALSEDLQTCLQTWSTFVSRQLGIHEIMMSSNAISSCVYSNKPNYCQRCWCGWYWDDCIWMREKCTLSLMPATCGCTARHSTWHTSGRPASTISPLYVGLVCAPIVPLIPSLCLYTVGFIIYQFTGLKHFMENTYFIICQ